MTKFGKTSSAEVATREGNDDDDALDQTPDVSAMDVSVEGGARPVSSGAAAEASEPVPVMSVPVLVGATSALAAGLDLD